MPMAAGIATPANRAAAAATVGSMQSPPLVMMSDAFAKDAIIAWFRGEFAAANAIIDALCGHIAEVSGGGGLGSEYEKVFAAIHRRRLNWISVLQMQKYHSIAEVALELRNVTEKKVDVRKDNDDEKMKVGQMEECLDNEKLAENGQRVTESENKCEVEHETAFEEDDSPISDITDSGSHEMQPATENLEICSNHETCDARRSEIKLTKGFAAKEHVKGHMVNVVKGLKLYEDVFTDSELSMLTDYANDLRRAGQNGELSGDTFILFNKQIKGNKRELIQFGVPIFTHIKDETVNNNEIGDLQPVPALLQSVIDHLVQWQLIPEYKKPNGCIINFFDEGEYSQPFLKPPHLDQPISTLLISESAMAFGRTLVCDNDGNYKGPLMLSLKEGSLLVMRGNSADTARHVMCPSLSKRISITFFRVRPESNQSLSPPTNPTTTGNGAMTLWQPGVPSPYSMPNGAPSSYDAMGVTPKWVLRAPMVMLAPVRPVVSSPRRIECGGTGVFLPWAVGSRKPAKHLPPRAQRGRFLALPSPVETIVAESAPDSAVSVEAKYEVSSSKPCC